jgi:hypothetical protein
MLQLLVLVILETFLNSTIINITSNDSSKNDTKECVRPVMGLTD